jgi:succinate-semialdehyde dehydrogenase/glutarate-semialdehyde dehydrogenase
MATQELIISRNPATEDMLATFTPTTGEQIEQALSGASCAFRHWRSTLFPERAELMRRVAAQLRRQKPFLANLVTAEMGKPLTEAEAEVEKCAWNCEYYAEFAETMLTAQPRDSTARESYTEFPPLGTILAIMPWNYPLWQVFRFAAPALMAGNTAILKHASNVPQCARAIAEVFQSSGFPVGVFQTLLLPGAVVLQLIADPRIAAVTVTGSDRAGSEIAAAAGRALKKTVLELGGSDPFIVLEDADLDAAVTAGVQARYQNAGQSCIAAKRFLIAEPVFLQFQERFVEAVRQLQVGDPKQRETQMGPLARADLRETLEQQVRNSVQQGATILIGGARMPGRGYFFAPTVLSQIIPTLPVACEEVFGPVASLMRVRTAEEAICVANESSYGLGAALWTADVDRARRVAWELEAGFVAINGQVASDPRLPFGGVKRSGYGRELADYGIQEFVNIQTVWIGPAQSVGERKAE